MQFGHQPRELGYEAALPLQVVSGGKTKPRDNGAHSRARERWFRMGDAKCSRGLELSSCVQIHYRQHLVSLRSLRKTGFFKAGIQQHPPTQDSQLPRHSGCCTDQALRGGSKSATVVNLISTIKAMLFKCKWTGPPSTYCWVGVSSVIDSN